MREPNKARYLKALQHVETVDVPFQENDPDITLVGKILEKDYSFGLRSYEIPSEDIVELNLRMGNDMVFFAHLWELGRQNKYDKLGRKHYVDGSIKTARDAEKIVLPDLDAARKRLEKVIKALDGTGMGLIYSVNHAPRISVLAMGYQTYCMNLYDNPGFVHDLQNTVNIYCLKELETALEYDADVIQISVDLCMNTGPMYSREVIEEYEYPLLRQSISMIKNKGKKACVHIDGDVISIIPDLIEMGVDVLNPIESCGGKQDIYAIKSKYGDKIALQGNINTAGVLAQGSCDEVKKDVIEHIEKLSAGGGYIVSSSHNITEAISIENFRRMRDAAHGYFR